MEEEVAREEQLKLMQDLRVYPVGRVLRDTFDANNHHTLGSDVAGLMINLSRVPYEPPVAGTEKQTQHLSPAKSRPSQAGQGRAATAAREGAALPPVPRSGYEPVGGGGFAAMLRRVGALLGQLAALLRGR